MANCVSLRVPSPWKDHRQQLYEIFVSQQDDQGMKQPY